MDKKKVLFVDDEKMVLEGLKRALRPMRKFMTMYFVSSGKEALELMERVQIDILVSDMRMPGVDGVKLLQITKDKYPETIRLVLTGQADEASTLKTICLAHQFLTKPCQSRALKRVLKRAMNLHELMTNPVLKRIIAGLDHLPSLPSMYLEIEKKIQDPNSSLNDIAKIIERDIGMSAKILQLVNSAFFGHYGHITSTARAVNILGLDIIKSLVLSLQIFSAYKEPGYTDQFLEYLWQHSLETAMFAKAIMETLTGKEDHINTAFTAGLLHDIGKLVLAHNMPEAYKTVLSICDKHDLSQCQGELLVFKASHAQVGGYLLGLWGFPGEIIESTSLHHDSKRCFRGDICLPAVVACADLISYMLAPEKDRYAGQVSQAMDIFSPEMEDLFQGWFKLCKDIRGQEG